MDLAEWEVYNSIEPILPFGLEHILTAEERMKPRKRQTVTEMKEKMLALVKQTAHLGRRKGR
jgi:hypothetical protein